MVGKCFIVLLGVMGAYFECGDELLVLVVLHDNLMLPFFEVEL